MQVSEKIVGPRQAAILGSLRLACLGRLAYAVESKPHMLHTAGLHPTLHADPVNMLYPLGD